MKAMKAIEQYFSVVLFIVPYKVVLTTESVDKILEYWCDNSNESSTAALSCGTACFSESYEIKMYEFQF